MCRFSKSLNEEGTTFRPRNKMIEIRIQLIYKQKLGEQKVQMKLDLEFYMLNFPQDYIKSYL